MTGEESPAQVKLRADRLGVDADDLYLLPTTSLNEIMEQLDRLKPSLVVVDSIQTVFHDDLPSEAGSVSQIRECARRLTQWAKTSGASVIMTGHVTKSGDIAGPRVLEHVVDVVLHIEGDPVSSFRLLRSIKNRFGSTNEVGVFEMTEKGMRDVPDPSAHLLAQHTSDSIGSVIVPALEGSRAVLVEVQALTNPSLLPTPRRVASGVDYNRMLLICAVLTRRAGRIPGVAGRDCQRYGRNEGRRSGGGSRYRARYRLECPRRSAGTENGGCRRIRIEWRGEVGLPDRETSAGGG